MLNLFLFPYVCLFVRRSYADGRCTRDMCWFDQTGAPISAVEPIAGYINPDTVIKVISDVDFHEDFPSARPGDIFVDFARNKPEVSSAMLGRTISPKSGDRWVRWIDTDSGEKIGFMFVERPVPDPDTRFESLAQDSLLAGIPTGLQSEINPASLIPSPTSGCATNKCLAVIPVRTRNFGMNLSAF